ncbi:hypothetical protein FNV43_RR25135 [Rhamnella rubrinervis]|uniref:DUF4050 domain-containing protein n=1 Tax=Rhamnella rubrinervis TaxID=2594499 RepID=A0A8K0DZG1_9ROSA|nr:hypothetical protein FNV43_RR25135 [Rhamnella rubrinervis]
MLEIMEVNTRNSHSNEKRPFDHSKSANQGKKSFSDHSKSAVQGKKTAEKEVNTSVFVNYAAFDWHERRRKWVGEQSQQGQRMAKDPIISWSTAYEDLLSTNEPFSEPIPLPVEPAPPLGLVEELQVEKGVVQNFSGISSLCTLGLAQTN